MTEHQTEDVRREQILDAATTLFVEHGYENTTVDEIAKQAGLSKGAIYWYFKSKLEILFALTDRYIHDEQMDVVQMAQNDYGAETLYKVHSELYRTKMTNPERDQVFCQLNSLASRFPEIGGKLAGYLRDWDQIVSTLIQEAVQDGKFRSTNPLYVSQAISAMYNGLFTRKQLDPNVDVLGVLEVATKLFYDALAVNKNNHSES